MVTPWFARDLTGGAERAAYETATGLAKRGHDVEILTTTGKSFLDDWSANHFRPGVSREDGLIVRRFALDSRKSSVFASVNAVLLQIADRALHPGVSPVEADLEEQFIQENINSTELLGYLRENKESYDAFLFIPYLYGPILRGWQIVRERAFLQPCLHDESYAYLACVSHMMRSVRGLLFNSEGEFELAVRLFGPGIIGRSTIGGSAIQPAVALHADFGPVVAGKFALYLGRRDATKNIFTLIDAFKEFRRRHPHSELRLVLAGPGSACFGDADAGVLDLEYVSEEEKEDLLQRCTALVQPSRNESYSRTMLEAWMRGKPVCVNADCLATAIPVRACGGGWTAYSQADWAQRFEYLENMADSDAQIRGALGKSYAREYAVWDRVLPRLESRLGLSDTRVAQPASRHSVTQILSRAADHATKRHAAALRENLRCSGFESDIKWGEDSDEEPSTGAVIYYHPLIPSRPRPARGVAAFAYGFDDFVSPAGEDALRAAASQCQVGIAASQRDLGRLREAGFTTTTLLPTIVDPSQWNIEPDTSYMRHLQDEKFNLLCAGKISKTNCQLELLNVFSALLTLGVDARLILAGHSGDGDEYMAQIAQYIASNGLGAHVLITGPISPERLLACYRTAHVYCSLAESDRNAYELDEALWFNMPVVAYRTAASTAALGESGILLRNKSDHLQIAALLSVLYQDLPVREAVIQTQRRQRVHAHGILAGHLAELETLLVRGA